MVYTHCLITSSLIQIWGDENNFKVQVAREEGGEPKADPKDHPCRDALVSNRADRVPLAERLATGLLRCSRIIAPAAAKMFYSRNTFAFINQTHWVPVAAWVDRIGETNRRYLTRLEAAVGTRDELAIPHRTGRHNYVDKGALPDALQLSEKIKPLSRSDEELDHGIKRTLSVLGRAAGAPKLTLTITLGLDTVPGIVSVERTSAGQTFGSSMNLPNMVEKWRVDYAMGVGRRPVEVLWKVESIPWWRNRPIENCQFLRKCGWQVLEAYKTHPVVVHGPQLSTFRYTLQRKELSGSLVALDESAWPAVEV